ALDRFARRPLTRSGEDESFEEPARERQGACGEYACHPCAEHRCLHESTRPKAKAHRFVVTESLAVSSGHVFRVRLSKESVRSTNDAGVDRGHQERGGPAPDVLVEVHRPLVILEWIPRTLAALGIEPVWVEEHASHVAIRPCGLDHAEHR